MRALLALCLLLAPQPSPSALGGQVTDALTALPLADARVLVTATESSLAPRTTRTDRDGWFSVDGLAPGRYRVSAVRDGFARADSDPLLAGGGDAPSPVRLALVPLGVITGRVVDPDGEPAAKVYVQAVAGQSRFEAQTDDRGEYRLFDLPAGSYVVSGAPYTAPRIDGATLVTPTPPSPFARGEGQGMIQVSSLLQAGNFINPLALAGERFARVYYPGTTDPAAATAVRVNAGAVITGVDLTTVIVATPAQ